MGNTLCLYNALKESIRLDISALKRRGAGDIELVLAKRILTNLELEGSKFTMLDRITSINILA